MAWAASFGVDEYGNEDHRHTPALVRQRRKRTNEMVEEILAIIDSHGLLRKPSWDGVRALMLFMPLTEGKPPLNTWSCLINHAPLFSSSKRCSQPCG